MEIRGLVSFAVLRFSADFSSLIGRGEEANGGERIRRSYEGQLRDLGVRMCSSIWSSVWVPFEVVELLRGPDPVGCCGCLQGGDRSLAMLVLEIDNKSGEGATGSVTSVFHFHKNPLERL
ncbi:hypothetical protein Droror1_Dr00025397, partial [Drosera rotundifolia]